MKLLITKEHYPSWMSLRMIKKYPRIIWRIMRKYYKSKGYNVEVLKDERN